MSAARVVRGAPFAAEGRRHFWGRCRYRCRRRARPPFCDSAHRDSGFEPAACVIVRTATVWLRGGGRSGDAPFRDAGHSRLPTTRV